MQRASLHESLLDDPQADTPEPSAAKPSSPDRCGWFTRRFPDPHTRVAVVLAFLLALGVSIWWLHYTISSRWIYSQHHPVQSVGFESAASLPGLIGFMFFYSAATVPSLLLHKILPADFANPAAASHIACVSSIFGTTPTDLCQQVDDHGVPIVWQAGPPPSELNGASASQLDPSSLPVQFLQTAVVGHGVCFTVYLLVNATAAEQAGQWDLPQFSVNSLSMQQLLSEQELRRAGHFQPDDPLTFSNFPGVAPLVGFYPVGQSVNLRFAATRTVSTNGDAALSYEYGNEGVSQHSPRYLDADFQTLMDWMDNATEVALWKSTRADPNVALHTQQLCLAPRSFNVQVIRLQTLYGFTSFLSDAGGFLNILSIVMFALFPVTYAVTKPRSFLPVWLSIRWKQRGKSEPPVAQVVAMGVLPSAENV